MDADGTDIALTVENTRIPEQPDDSDEPATPTDPDEPAGPVDPEQPADPIGQEQPIAPSTPEQPLNEGVTDTTAPVTPIATTGVDVIRTGDDNGRSMRLLAGAGLTAAVVMAAVALRVAVGRRSYWKKL